MSKIRKYSSHLDWIDKEFKSSVKLLESWVDINSWSENPAGLNKMSEMLKTAFFPLGDHVAEISLKPFKRIELRETLSVPLGKLLSIVKRPQAKRKILMGGHMDTVFPPECNFQKSSLPSSDKMIGPGCADMKGGLAILYMGIQAFEKSPFAEEIGWEIVINPDEEIGSVGSKKILSEKAAHYDIGIWFEPSFSDGAIAGQRKGSANFTIMAKGIPAHVGRDFHLGKSAVTALARFIVKLETFQDIAEGLTINVGNIQGGGPLNIVPDLALCKINIRFNQNEDLYSIEQKLQDLATIELNQTGIAIEVHRDLSRPPKFLDEKTENLYQQFKECASMLDQQLFLRPTGGVSDGNILANAGLPNLDTMGAIGGNIHTNEEYIFIDSLQQRSKLLALFLMNYADKGF